MFWSMMLLHRSYLIPDHRRPVLEVIVIAPSSATGFLDEAWNEEVRQSAKSTSSPLGGNRGWQIRPRLPTVPSVRWRGPAPAAAARRGIYSADKLWIGEDQDRNSSSAGTSSRRWCRVASVARRLQQAAGRWPRARPQPLANGLEDDVERRDREDADERGQDHAAEHRRADVASRELEAPVATTSG